MGVRGLAVFYVFMIGLVYVALSRGSLPRNLDMSFAEVFSFFFLVITVSVAVAVYVVWSVGRKRH